MPTSKYSTTTRIKTSFAQLQRTGFYAQDYVDWFTQHPELIPGLPKEWFSRVDVDMELAQPEFHPQYITIAYALTFTVEDDDNTIESVASLSEVMCQELELDDCNGPLFRREYCLFFDVGDAPIALVEALLCYPARAEEPNALELLCDGFIELYPQYKPEFLQNIIVNDLLPDDEDGLVIWLQSLGKEVNIELGSDLA